MRIFINYIYEKTENPQLTEAIVRWTISIYVLWKLWSYDLTEYVKWPPFIYQSTHQYKTAPYLFDFIIYHPYLILGIISVITLVFLSNRIPKVSSLALSVSLSIFTFIHYSLTNSTSTFLVICIALSIYAITYDKNNVEFINLFLKYALIFVAVTYFITGASKLIHSGIGWATAENLRSYIISSNEKHLINYSILTTFVLDSTWLLGAIGIGTLVLEVGTIFFLFMRLNMIFYISALLMMHLGIAVIMGPNFFDQFIVFSLFLNFERIRKKIV
ncbi:hypothetical protein EP331_15645 [bacterium]|nr:MAG: hypothetical protein EP331_15645 [bacterium]